jgi:hypothetical protein
MWQDYIVLEDHPDAEEFINGAKMNFRECGLMVLQRLSKLNAAADQLKDKVTLLKLFDCQAGIFICFKMDSLAILKT